MRLNPAGRTDVVGGPHAAPGPQVARDWTRLKVTFCFRQIFCMPRRLRADSDDAAHDRRVLVEHCRDGAVVHVNELIIRSGIGTECTNDVSSESTLVN